MPALAGHNTHDCTSKHYNLLSAVVTCAVFACAVFACAVFACAVFACAVFPCAVFPRAVFACAVFSCAVLFLRSVCLRSVCSNSACLLALLAEHSSYKRALRKQTLCDEVLAVLRRTLPSLTQAAARADRLLCVTASFIREMTQ